MLPIKRILCPTDFSGAACTCIRAASELAEHFDAELILINVVPAVPTLPPDPNYVFKIPEYEMYLHADAEKQLRKAREELVGKNVKVRTMVGHGSAAEEIVLVAKKDSVGLIVISTHGSTGFNVGFWLGRRESCARLADCPALTFASKTTAHRQAGSRL